MQIEECSLQIEERLGVPPPPSAVRLPPCSSPGDLRRRLQVSLPPSPVPLPPSPFVPPPPERPWHCGAGRLLPTTISFWAFAAFAPDIARKVFTPATHGK